MRTFGTHSTVIIWERTAERGKVFTFNPGIWVESFTVNTMLGGRMIRNFWVCAMTTQFVRIVHPPAVAVFRIVARVVICASTHFANSVRHNSVLLLLLFIRLATERAVSGQQAYLRSFLLMVAVALRLVVQTLYYRADGAVAHVALVYTCSLSVLRFQFLFDVVNTVACHNRLALLNVYISIISASLRLMSYVPFSWSQR